jgi:hypothetical protein
MPNVEAAWPVEKAVESEAATVADQGRLGGEY